MADVNVTPKLSLSDLASRIENLGCNLRNETITSSFSSGSLEQVE
jgi:hypothetical protein